MPSPVALQKINHHPPPSCLCSLSREPPLLKVLATACISALDAQMGSGVPDHCSHVSFKGSKCPTAGPKEVIATSVCISTRRLSLDKYPISAYSRVSLLLVKSDFFKTIDRRLALSPDYIKYGRFQRQNHTFISIRIAHHCAIHWPRQHGRQDA